MKLKRVWDVTEKKIARVPWANWKPCQVWYKEWEEKFYKQDINGLVELDGEEISVYWPNWEAMNTDDLLGYYDTNEPTELFTPEDWDEATYTFEDYDETVLKTGKVKDWGTPVAPEDPTRVGYTFTGWKPKVKAIYKDTTYTAQYEEVPAPEAEDATLFLANLDADLAIYVDGSEEAVQSLTLPVKTDTVFYINENILYIGSVNDAEPTHTITVDWADEGTQFSGWTLGTPDWDITPEYNTDYVVWDVMTQSKEVNLYCEYTL